MLSAFQDDFATLVFKRVGFSGNTLLVDPQYIKFSKEEDRLTNEITQIIGDSQLLFDLEEATNMIMSITAEHAYRQGLKDGIQLRQELGLVS